MEKLLMPSRPYQGMKIFCKKCGRDNPKKCKHFDRQCYRVRIHVPGSYKEVRSKVLVSRNYDEAVVEAIKFKKELVCQNFVKSVLKSDETVDTDVTILNALIKYNQYLEGNNDYAHLKKNISVGFKDELIRYCSFFCENLERDKKEVKIICISKITKKDVSSFYKWAESHYLSPRTFNKCLAGVKGFFDFLIQIEDAEIKNPFQSYVIKKVPKSEIEIVDKEDFLLIIDAIDTFDPKVTLGGKGKEVKNMYRPYLKDGFKLFLLTGGRREEVVDLRWSDIMTTSSGFKFFKVHNIKVESIKKAKGIFKYIPINDELFDLLKGMGYDDKIGTDDYILYPERKVKSKTIMNDLSKAFTHYRKGAGVQSDIRLNTLRKTYLTWVNQAMGIDTKILSSHASDGVLKEFYIDPKILTTIEKGALHIKIFG